MNAEREQFNGVLSKKYLREESLSLSLNPLREYKKRWLNRALVTKKGDSMKNGLYRDSYVSLRPLSHSSQRPSGDKEWRGASSKYYFLRQRLLALLDPVNPWIAGQDEPSLYHSDGDHESSLDWKEDFLTIMD